MGEELAAFLNTLKALNANQFEAVEKALQILMPNIDGIEIEVSDLGEVELRLKEGGVAIPARVLSEGTLRMLGLLALTGVDEGPALVGFEEPENGIHPRRIQLIAELLKTQEALNQTQHIITTHSPILSDLNERMREIVGGDEPAPMILAIPDPHIERWLLLDGSAFKAVFGQGCSAPDRKCSRNRYKQLLIEAICDAGRPPLLGGLEYAEDILRHMYIERVTRVDRSFGRFVGDLRQRHQVLHRRPAFLGRREPPALRGGTGHRRA